MDDVETTYKVGEVIIVPVGTKHRVENRQDEDLKFIEVQTGTYFGEDDIVRLDDDYDRIKKEDSTKKVDEKVEKVKKKKVKETEVYEEE